jgi:hypothetical protein
MANRNYKPGQPRLTGSSESKPIPVTKHTLVKSFIRNNIVIANDVRKYVIISEAYDRYKQQVPDAGSKEFFSRSVQSFFYMSIVRGNIKGADGKKNVGVWFNCEGNNEMKVFDFNGKELRVYEATGKRWFVAVDICAILDVNIVRALRSVAANKITSVQAEAVRMKLIHEDALDGLLFLSKHPEKEAFRDWVETEVLQKNKNDADAESH